LNGDYVNATSEGLLVAMLVILCWRLRNCEG